MVINVNTGMVSGSFSEAGKAQEMEKENGKTQVKNGTVFGGNFKQKFDPVAIKKEQAQKQAMKLWTDAVDAQQDMDNEMEERVKHMEQLKGLMEEAKSQINAISDSQAALAEKYGIKEGSQEQADAELLIKQSKNKGFPEGMGETFTDEEKARLEELKGSELEEYVGRYMELENGKSMYQEDLDAARKEYVSESNVIKEMKKARLKTHIMVDAQKEKDEMMIAASKDAAFGMMNEVKEKIDEEQAEQKEKAEEKAEKEEAEEELREAIREKAEGKEENDETNLETTETEEFVQLDSVKDEITQEVKKMVDEMNLLMEDLKGASVDKVL